MWYRTSYNSVIIEVNHRVWIQDAQNVNANLQYPSPKAEATWLLEKTVWALASVQEEDKITDTRKLSHQSASSLHENTNKATSLSICASRNRLAKPLRCQQEPFPQTQPRREMGNEQLQG